MDYLYVSSLENLQSKITVYRFDGATNAFILEGLKKAENCQTFSVSGAEPNLSNALFVSSSDFLNPSTYLYSEEGGVEGSAKREIVKVELPLWFDTKRHVRNFERSDVERWHEKCRIFWSERKAMTKTVDLNRPF